MHFWIFFFEFFGIKQSKFIFSDDETFLTEKDFKNGEKLGEDHVAAGSILWKQVYKKGDIRGKAAWKLVCLFSIYPSDHPGQNPINPQKSRDFHSFDTKVSN